MHVVSSVAVDRPVGDVFTFLADPNNQMLWQSNLREVHPSGQGQGAKLTEVRAVMGFKVEYELAVKEFVQDSKIIWEGESKVHKGGGKVTRTFEVEPRGTKTIVTYEITV